MNIDETKKFAAGLKVGDQAAIKCRTSAGRGYLLVTLQRRTPTQLVFDKGYRARATDGALIGIKYTRIEPVTDSVLEAIRVSDVKQWVDYYAKKEILNLEPLQIIQIRDLVKAMLAENEAKKEDPNA